ncbi:MAG: molybdopterin molybdotransferase MoeA [Nitrososphaerales archaeon]
MRRPDLKDFPKPSSVKEGFDIISRRLNLKPLDCETVPTYDSIGRVLGKSVLADADIPWFDRSTVDGYATKSQDTMGASKSKGIRLKITGRVFPEDFVTDVRVDSREAAYVACGAPLPIGADAVVKVEETDLLENYIKIFRPLAQWENVSRVGEEVEKGSIVLRKGRVLGASDLGLLAMLRMREVKVFKRPIVGIVSVGSELTELSMRYQNKFVNSNAIIVAGLTSEIGAVPMILGVVSDDLNEIKNKIEGALERSDMIIIIGGSSFGVKDLVPDAVNALGKPGIILHGIAVVPGRTTGVGMVKGKTIIILPGRTASTMAGFYLFAAPIINMLRGLGMVQTLPIIEAELSERVEAKPGLESFLFVRVKRTENRLVAEPSPKENAMANLARAHGYIIVPAGNTLDKGAKADVRVFDMNGLSPLNGDRE